MQARAGEREPGVFLILQMAMGINRQNAQVRRFYDLPFPVLLPLAEQAVEELRLGRLVRRGRLDGRLRASRLARRRLR